jgi:hypothetical protein
LSFFCSKHIVAPLYEAWPWHLYALKVAGRSQGQIPHAALYVINMSIMVYIIGVKSILFSSFFGGAFVGLFLTRFPFGVGERFSQ